MLEIKTVKKGAELVSVKANGIEKMHDTPLLMGFGRGMQVSLRTNLKQLLS